MKKNFSIILSCMLLASSVFVGCGNNPSKASNSDNSSTTSQEQNEIKDQKLIEPPDEGWTIEELLSVTYLYGNQMSYPITLNSLPDEVEGRDQEPNISGNIMVRLYHGDEMIGFGLYDTKSEDEVDMDTPFNYIQFFIDKETDDSLVINGKSLGSDYENMTDYLGQIAEDNDDSDNTIFYKTKDDSFKLDAVVSANVFTTLAIYNMSDIETDTE